MLPFPKCGSSRRSKAISGRPPPLETSLLKFRRPVTWRKGKSPPAAAAPNLPPSGPLANRRLEQLILQARAVLLFERLWRLLAPPLMVIGAFVCLSWTGIWFEAPHWARGLGVLCLAAGVLAALLPVLKFRFPSRKDALTRLDQVSDRALRPAAILEDRPANAAGDLATRAFWNLHRRRAEHAIASLRTGPPSPRLADLDRYALRAAILVGLVATAFIAGPERYGRLAAAFDWSLDGFSGGGRRLDAWIDPPAYTGKPPIVLRGDASASGAVQKIEAPTGSVVVIRSSGGRPAIEVQGALEAPKDKAAGPAKTTDDFETKLVLRGDARLKLGAYRGPDGAFDLIAIPDKPPSIELTDAPAANARGSLTLKYRMADDYGVISAEAVFSSPSDEDGKPFQRSLADPPQTALVLPAGGGSSGEALTIADLSEHPWAGARVRLTLTARDEGGNEGKSPPVELVLPEKPFSKPLARALAEQRRNLVLAPDDKARVATALDALMIAPDVFDTSSGVYLGLRTASQRLAASKKDADLMEIADYLWAMALQIENGDLSEAERDLRAAEQQLREALQRDAPADEIQKLSENLRAAMDKFVREFAQKQKQDGEADSPQMKGRGRAISPKDLQAMLDKMQAMARAGDSAEAQKMLEQLQNILENLQMARPRKADPRARELSRAIDELGQMSKEQQDLRDETYQSGESARRQQRRQRGEMGASRLPFEDPADNMEDNADGGNEAAPPNVPNAPDLARRQQALRDKLDKLNKQLKQMGQGENGLNDAQDAMGEAQRALGQGSRNTETAVDAQGRALESLRQGAQKLGENMRKQGEGEPSESAQGEGEGEGQGEDGQTGQEGSADPLGRGPSGAERNPSARYNPLGVPAAQRVHRVLEELRRRLGDPARPREELDYLERLLRRY
jgi:uncharacterized protein (TIGR02302 family)